MSESLANLNNAVQLILPEIALLATVCLILFAAPFLVGERGEARPGLRHRWGSLALVGWGLAALLWWQSLPAAATKPIGMGLSGPSMMYTSPRPSTYFMYGARSRNFGSM